MKKEVAIGDNILRLIETMNLDWLLMFKLELSIFALAIMILLVFVASISGLFDDKPCSHTNDHFSNCANNNVSGKWLVGLVKEQKSN